MIEEDRLTRLKHESFLDEVLEIEVMRSERYERSFSLVLFRIDVPAGMYSEVFYPLLKVISSRVKRNIRVVDTAFRVGNEILLVLPETGADGAAMAAAKLKTFVESEAFNVSPVFPDLKVGLSFAVATFPGDSRDERDLVRIVRGRLEAQGGTGLPHPEDEGPEVDPPDAPVRTHAPLTSSSTEPGGE
jgi:diguanylate cyclase (GGDEF)-like protein